MDITKALSDENRVRILMMLQEGELCVCQLVDVLHLAPSTVSKHLSLLYQAHLVQSRKKGRWVYYRLANQEAPLRVQKALGWVYGSLSQNSVILEDAKRLKLTLEMAPEDLCKTQG